jgi:hypothetical protein
MAFPALAALGGSSMAGSAAATGTTMAEMHQMMAQAAQLNEVSMAMQQQFMIMNMNESINASFCNVGKSIANDLKSSSSSS